MRSVYLTKRRRVKAVTFSHASTMFITNNGQAHAIPMRWEVEKEKVIHALQFRKNKEVDYLATLIEE